MHTLDDAVQAIQTNPRGVLIINNPQGQPVAALLSLPAMQEFERVMQGELAAAQAVRRPTRKERKQKAAARKAAEANVRRSRSGRPLPHSFRWGS